jgi:hypothetical protein
MVIGGHSRAGVRLRQEVGGADMTRIETLSARLVAVLARQDAAFGNHRSEAYITASIEADELRADIAAASAETVEDVQRKARALGPCPASAIGSLSAGEQHLLVSIVRDIRKLADIPALVAA